MSQQIERRASASLARDQRRTVVGISRANSDSTIVQARVDAEADIALAKIDALTAAAGYGLGAVAKVVQTETVLAQNFPGASGRLAYVAERHMVQVGDALDDLHKRVIRK